MGAVQRGSCRSCGAQAPANTWLTVTDLEVSRVADLLAGDLDHALCKAGCRLGTTVGILFRDTESRRSFAAAGDLAGPADMSDTAEAVADLDGLRHIVRDLIDNRVQV